MLPNFFVVGSQKSGTTSLHHYLKSHPDIYLPDNKETKFFIKDELYKKGLDFYEKNNFSSWDGEKAIGEVDPDYMFYEEALNRIADNIPNPKFIFIFRNPAERAFSQYLMTYRRGKEKLSFQDAIQMEHKRILDGYYGKMDYSYVSRGYYLQQVKRFLKIYDISQMLFLSSDELRNNTIETLKECYEFLNVTPDWCPPNIMEQYHQASAPKSVSLYRAVRYQSPLKSVARLLVPSKTMRKTIRDAIYDWNTTDDIRQTMTDETRHYLIELYREENLRLGELIGCDLNHWNQ